MSFLEIQRTWNGYLANYWGGERMKYQLHDGRIMSEDELRELWLANTHCKNIKDCTFDFWLYFKVECGAIKEIKE